MLVQPHCLKCGSNARLVVYRRTLEGTFPGVSHEWVCSSCAGFAESNRYRGFEVRGDVEERVATPTVRRAQSRAERPAGMKPKYTGFRVVHDPLR